MNPQNHNQFNYVQIVNYKAIFRFVLTWFITIAILVLLFSRIKFVDVMAIIKQTDIKLFCTSILFSLLAHVFFSSSRYQEVVKLMGCRLSLFESIIIRMGCNPIKGMLPFKIGELTILAYMKKTHDLSYDKGFFSLLFGYIFSFIILMLFYSLGGLFYFHNLSQRILFALVFLFILLLILSLSFRQITQLLAKYLKKYQKLPNEWTSLMEKCDPETIKILLLHSFGIEGSKLIIILALLESLHIEIPINVLLLLGSTTIIAAYLPITYWGLGIRESTILFLFSGYATPDKLLAGSLLITFVDSLLPVLLGLFFIKPFLNSLWGREKEGMDIVSNGK